MAAFIMIAPQSFFSGEMLGEDAAGGALSHRTTLS
jgi:hypothetical protein